MSTGAIVAIIVAVALVILVIASMTAMRRRQLRQRFGPEYDRVAGEMHSQRKADAELAERERRVRSLDIRPLDETTRVKYAAEWTAIQERFVDQPEQAVAQAGLLITAVMKDRGYPTEDHDQILADLSVEHANTLDHYRTAHQVSMQAEAGTAETEDMRLAMLHYRALFGDLLGEPSGPQPAESQPVEPQLGALAAEPDAGATRPGTATSPGAATGAETTGGGAATDTGAATDDRPPVPAPRSRPSS
jgi:hypothetical protein